VMFKNDNMRKIKEPSYLWRAYSTGQFSQCFMWFMNVYIYLRLFMCVFRLKLSLVYSFSWYLKMSPTMGPGLSSSNILDSTQLYAPGMHRGSGRHRIRKGETSKGATLAVGFSHWKIGLMGYEWFRINGVNIS
jgi:hypothetical protein